MKLVILCGLVLLLAFCKGQDTCKFNSCYCPEDEPLVLCGVNDAADPRFSLLERLFTRELIISDQQEELLKTVCERFPTLEKMTYEGDSCPVLKCIKPTCQ